MVLVALAALALGGWRWPLWRRVQFTKLADYHDSRIAYSQYPGPDVRKSQFFNKKGTLLFEKYWISPLYRHLGGGAWAFDVVDPRLQISWDRIKANQDWHKAMKQKYLRAAARPWLPVMPDPPEPPLPKGLDDL
jgi:hypothetical protein